MKRNVILDLCIRYHLICMLIRNKYNLKYLLRHWLIAFSYDTVNEKQK